MSAAVYDLMIIGAGSAGLTAGLYAARATLKTLAIDKGVIGDQLWNTPMIEDYPLLVKKLMQHSGNTSLAHRAAPDSVLDCGAGAGRFSQTGTGGCYLSLGGSSRHDNDQ